MIKTRSKHDILIFLASPLTGAICSEYTLNIYIWEGDSSSIPTETTYQITKKNVLGESGVDYINIARLVNDYISFDPNVSNDPEIPIELLDSNNQVWVHTEVVYTTADPLDDDVKQSPLTQLAVKGYNYSLEGTIQTFPTNGLLIDGDLFRVDKSKPFYLSILADEARTVNVDSFPDANISETFSISASTDTEGIIQVLNLNFADIGTDNIVEVEMGGSTITLVVNEEEKHDVNNIMFINKHGGQQVIPFLKQKKETLNLTRETYESLINQPSTGAHQYVDFNVKGKTSLSLTSGFYPESMNESFKQLMLSSSVWLVDGTDVTPVNITKTSLEYKTRLNDRLISYDFDFNYAFNEVNS